MTFRGADLDVKNDALSDLRISTVVSLTMPPAGAVKSPRHRFPAPARDWATVAPLTTCALFQFAGPVFLPHAKGGAGRGREMGPGVAADAHGPRPARLVAAGVLQGARRLHRLHGR